MVPRSVRRGRGLCGSTVALANHCRRGPAAGDFLPVASAFAARQQRPDQRFVIVTGYLDSEAVEIAAPGTPVVTKPFDPDVLRKLVRELAA